MGIHFGVDYYPEHWPEERWERDAELMRGMGVQVVRMGEFSWHKAEPSDGVFDFSWLDRAVSLLGSYGIKTVLGTPTAAPPLWLVRSHPEILPVDRTGIVRGFGGRHHDCQSSKTYREYVGRLVDRLSSHFASNPYVIGWQIDNELGNSHNGLCFCQSCERAFQEWLERKYHDIDSLNRAWGNAFWGEEANSFSEIPAPRITVTGENPSALLDWKLFHSDLIVDFLSFQEEIIRHNSPGKFITHNLMGFSDVVSYYDLSRHLDFVSHDNYPMLFDGKETLTPSYELSASFDLMRSLKMKPFWIMEEQAGITGWQVMSRSPEPGQLSLWSVQAIAHGADCVVYFRWRTSSMGTEQYWHGLLPHSGKPGWRYEEIKGMIGKLSPLMDELEGEMPSPEIAVLYSYREKYAMDLQRQSEGLSYLAQVLKYIKPLHERNVSIDFVNEDSGLSGYKLVLAPLLYITDEVLEEKLISYVRDGGRLLLTMRSGVKDASNLVKTDSFPPGALSSLSGVLAEDYDPLGKDSVMVCFGGKEYKAEKWADRLRLQGAETLAVYSSGPYKGLPAITRSGGCFYVGTEPSEELMGALTDLLLKDAGIASDSTGLEERKRGPFLFVLNHSPEAKPFPGREGYVLRAKSSDVEGLEGFGWAVLKRD